MEEALWWIYITTSVVLFLTLMHLLWIFYLIMETQHAIDELETCVLSVLDDALQILIPMTVLNQISQFDVANFEMNVDVKKTSVVRYAEDVSQPLSEKSQAYSFFGDSDRKKIQRSDDDMSMHMRIDRVKSMHSLEVVVKTPVTEGKRNSKSGNENTPKKIVVQVTTAKSKASESEAKNIVKAPEGVVKVLDECPTQHSETTGTSDERPDITMTLKPPAPKKVSELEVKTQKSAPVSEVPKV